MNRQPDLFETSSVRARSARYPMAPGHRGDPVSKEAADRIAGKAKPLQRRVLQHLSAAEDTVHRTAAALALPVPTIQPRFSELRAQGLIEPAGRGTNDNGATANVWRITAKGREELHNG